MEFPRAARGRYRFTTWEAVPANSAWDRQLSVARRFKTAVSVEQSSCDWPATRMRRTKKHRCQFDFSYEGH